jgi:hypothetical protein
MYSTLSLNLSLDGRRWSMPHHASAALPPGKRLSTQYSFLGCTAASIRLNTILNHVAAKVLKLRLSTDCTGGWVGPRAFTGIRSPAVQPSHCTSYTILASSLSHNVSEFWGTDRTKTSLWLHFHRRKWLKNCFPFTD